MHILFITDNFPPETNAPASRTYEHARRWVRSGHRVTIITGVPNFPLGRVYQGYRNRLLQRELLDGIEIVRVLTYITPNRGFIRRTLDYMSFMASAILLSPVVKEVDVVVATSPQFFAAVAGCLIAKLKKKPFVFELRDLWPDSITALGVLKKGQIVKFLQKLEYYLYRQAAAIVSVTESYRKILAANGVEAEKIHFIPNGADLEIYWLRPKDQEIVKRYGLEGKFVVSYIGTLGMAHGLQTLLSAAETLKESEDIVFLIIGEGAEKKALMEAALRDGLSNIMFVEGQPKSEIIRFWSVSDATLVLLKRADLFKRVIPSKIFEAFAMQVPVILGVEGEAAEIVKQARAGLLVEPEDSMALAEAVFKLHSDCELRKQMGRNGRFSVEKVYNRDISADQMLQILEASR